MAAIDALLNLVPPPPSPVDNRGDWARVEADLGLPVPADFKALIEHYGAGTFVSDLRLYPPFGEQAMLVSHARELYEDREGLGEQWTEDCPYPVYPEPGGLLIWCGNGNGDRLCWLTQGPPDEWPVLVWTPDLEHDLHPVGAVEFLHGWLTGQIDSPALGDWQYAGLDPWFDPWIPWTEVYVQLSGSPLPYLDRLTILRDVLAPTADRGHYEDARGHREDHFAATGRDWLVTYRTGLDRIQLVYPEGDEQRVRSELPVVAERMGCQVLAVTTLDGEPVWID